MRIRIIYLTLAVLVSFNGCATTTALLIKNPSTAQDYYKRGLYYFSHSGGFDRKAAIREFTQAIDIDPDYRDAYTQRAICYSFIDTDLAIADFSQAIKVCPNDASLYVSRANHFYHKGDYDSAISDFDMALSLQPDDWSIYYSRALFYYEIDEFEKAITDLEEVNSFRPNDWFPYALKGKLLGRLNRIDEAINALKIADKKIPTRKFDTIFGFIVGGIFGAWTLHETSRGYSATQRNILIKEPIRELEEFKKSGQLDNLDDEPIAYGMTPVAVLKRIEKNERILWGENFGMVSVSRFGNKNDGFLNVYQFKDDSLISIENIPLQGIMNLPDIPFPSSEDKLQGILKKDFLELVGKTNMILCDSEEVTIAVGQDQAVKDKRIKQFNFKKGKFLQRGYIFKKLW